MPRLPNPQPPRPPRAKTPPPPPPAPRRSAGQMSPLRPGASAEGQLAEAVAEALFGKPKRRMPAVPVVPPTPSGDPVEDTVFSAGGPVVGSVLQFTSAPRGWVARLTNEAGDTWDEPVVGWAVVVTWTAYSSEVEPAKDEGNSPPKPDGDPRFQTEVQPMTLTDSGAMELIMFREGVELVGHVRI